VYQEIVVSYQSRIRELAAKRYCAITYELYLCMFYAIVEVKKLYQKTLKRGDSRISPRESGAVFERRYFRGAKGDYGEEAKKLLFVCVKNQRHLMNHKVANNDECESRLRQTESADVAAGIGVRKT
jgi:hypothetical protein